MLANPQISRLVSNLKTNRALCGNLLPLNNNSCFIELADVDTVTVVEDDPKKGAVPVAFGLFNKCTANQAYCALVATFQHYEDVFVNVEQVKTKSVEAFGLDSGRNEGEHTLLKISNKIAALPDLSGLPQYFSAFAEPVARPLFQCVVDQLIEQSMGSKNVESNRNITVDLYDSNAGYPEHSDELWRDYSGFLVSDRFRYCEIEMGKEKFAKVTRKYLEDSSSKADEESEVNDTDYKFEKISKENFDLVLDYDQSVALMNRQSYLEYIFSLVGVVGTIAVDSQQQPLGYVFSLGGHVLQCYTESKRLASRLLLEHITTSIVGEETLSMFVRLDCSWMAEQLAKSALKVRRVRRFHTRIVPTNVKWQKVFAYNTGVHLF